jgi:DNA-binding Xre family transcriptional regulator
LLNYTLTKSNNFLDDHANIRTCYLSSLISTLKMMGEDILEYEKGGFEGVNDLRDFVIYPDGCVSTSWYIDDHEPDPENAKRFKEPWLSCGKPTPLDFYPIPFRCLYNKDVANMFMAGRNISVSHLALGTVRVMRTCAMEGEVVGMAANLCRELGCRPRDIYKDHFEKLQELMKKGVGDPTMPYLQTYTLIDTTAVRHEDC